MHFNRVLERNAAEVSKFFDAVENDDIFEVREMLKENKLLVLEMNSSLETPLHVALRLQKSRKLCEVLVHHGADFFHIRDLQQQTCYDRIMQLPNTDFYIGLAKSQIATKTSAT